jgi:hypothetical protein
MISCYDEEQDSLYLRWRFGMAHGAMRIFFKHSWEHIRVFDA